MAGITDLVVLGIIGGGLYYAYSSGMLNQLLGGGGGMGSGPYGLPTESDIAYEEMIAAEGEEDGDEDGDKKGKRKGGKGGGGGKRRKNRDREQQELYESGGIPPQYQGPPQYQYQGPPRDMYGNPLSYNQTGQWQNRNVLPGPPGSLSSLHYQNIPSTPPYVSPTVNTYSQYSPYNQFTQYTQYQTPQTGYMQTAGDDNINFFDIDTSTPACQACKSACMSNVYGFTCRSCRMSCKKATHYYRPPQTGWTITPAGGMGTGAYSFLGQVWDTLTGGATFAEMDDYSEKRRFDCHNKLKRRIKGKDNSFVSREDYHWDRNDISLANV